jgi:hypothetical protein
VNLTALGTPIEMLCLFSDQHCGLLDGDRGGRRRARVASVEFEQVTAYDDLLGLESYFSSSLHRLVPSLPANSSTAGGPVTRYGPALGRLLLLSTRAWVKISTVEIALEGSH